MPFVSTATHGVAPVPGAAAACASHCASQSATLVHGRLPDIATAFLHGAVSWEYVRAESAPTLARVTSAIISRLRLNVIT